MKRLNNKGYMIIEIIVASVIAMTIAYFLMDLVVKLKEKYDYVQNDTILMADKTVITNEILGDLYERDICSAEIVEEGKGIKFSIKGSTDIMILKYEEVTIEEKTQHWIRYYENEVNPNNVYYQKPLNELLQVKSTDISFDSTNNIASFIIKAETLTSTKNYGVNIILPVEGVCS